MTSWLDIPITQQLVRGAVEIEARQSGLVLHRLPAWARAQTSDQQLSIVEAQPAGVRIASRTTATAIELRARATKRVDVGMPSRPDGVYQLTVDGRVVDERSLSGGNRLHVDNGVSAGIEPGDAETLQFTGLPAGDKSIEIWLPHNEIAELVGLRANAVLWPEEPARRTIWVHHGSSISQGQNAIAPTDTWPAVAAARARLDLLNLGFGGGALLDPFVARVIRDMPADLISLKLGINVVNRDLMRLRAFGPAVHGFLDMIRDGHPTTPLIVISPIFCPIHETQPGPVEIDPGALATGVVRYCTRSTGGDPTRLTLELIRNELSALVSSRQEHDANLHYLDGLHLYGPGDHAVRPLPDALHPALASHREMGERFAGYLNARLLHDLEGRRDGTA